MFKVKYNYFSHSSLHTYLQCPRRYKLRYIDKLRVPQEMKHLDLGNCIHEILEFWRGGTKEEFKKFVKEKVAKYNLKKHFETAEIAPHFKNIPKCFNEYVKPYLETAVMEYPFKKFYIGTYVTSGKIDLYVPPIVGKKGFIIDYKTGKKAQITKDYEEQLMLYAIVICELEGYKLSDFKIGCYFVKQGEFIEADFDESDLTDYRRTFERWGDRVQRDEEFKKKTGPLCPYCEYYINKKCSGQDEDNVDFDPDYEVD